MSWSPTATWSTSSLDPSTRREEPRVWTVHVPWTACLSGMLTWTRCYGSKTRLIQSRIGGSNMLSQRFKGDKEIKLSKFWHFTFQDQCCGWSFGEERLWEYGKTDGGKSQFSQARLGLSFACLKKQNFYFRDDFEVSCPELDILVEAALKVWKCWNIVSSNLCWGWRCLRKSDDRRRVWRLHRHSSQAGIRTESVGHNLSRLQRKGYLLPLLTLSGS